MYQIIAPTLFQNKICRLPGIGTLVMTLHPAENDYINAQIKSPFESIDFLPEEDNDKGFNEFSAMSELLNKKLDESGSFFLNGIGNFVKAETGAIQFAPVSIDPVFTPSVAANIISRQAASHTMMVGDQETTSMEMTDYFSEKSAVKDQWWVWAGVLAVAGISVLIYYFNKHGVNGFGNVSY
jgi:hypothetical protein